MDICFHPAARWAASIGKVTEEATPFRYELYFEVFQGAGTDERVAVEQQIVIRFDRLDAYVVPKGKAAIPA